MYFKFSIKTIFRSPLKTLVTFLLLAAVSAAFVSRGAEFVMTIQAIDAAEDYYVALGTVRATPELYGQYPLHAAFFPREFMPVSDEAAETVLSSGYVSASETRPVAGGTTSDDIRSLYELPLAEYNVLDEGRHDQRGNMRMDAGALIVQCTDICAGNVVLTDGTYMDMAVLQIEEVIAGSPERFQPRNTIYIPRLDSGTILSDARFRSQIQEGHRCFIVLQAENDRYIAQYEPAEVQCPVFDLTRIEEEYGTGDWREVLENPGKYGVPELKSELPPSELEDRPAWQIVSTETYMERLNRNLHTVELVHTGSMENLMRFHDNTMYIADGSAITGETAGDVCVVSADYAAYNDLKVGDNIEFEVSADTMMHSGRIYGRRPPNIERNSWDAFYEAQAFSDLGLEPVKKTYRIIGLWTDTAEERESDPFAFSLNTVFVPQDAYPWPDDVEQPIMPSTFSFTLKHPGDVEKFEEEISPALAELGYELVIDDMGYAGAKHSLEMMEASALVSFAAMGGALLLALLLTVYLFIVRRKYDYAIMRAMGTSTVRAGMSLLVGLAVLAAASVCVGCAAASVITRNAGAELAARLMEITGEDVRASLSYLTICAFGAGELVLLMLMAALGLRRVGRKPPLELLQGGK